MIHGDTTRLFRIFLITCILLLPSTAAEPRSSSAISAGFVPPDREIVAATKEAPPFAMKGPEGNWQGISIDLWRRVADQLHL
jgi:polar amino acid transport system substrate-binding protein